MLTHQLYNKYHSCEKTKQTCLCCTHTYTQCRIWGMWWKPFFVSFTAAPWVPPRQRNIFAFGLASPTLLQVQVSLFYWWVRVLQEPTGPPAHSFPQSHSSQTHLHFFLPKRQTWMDDIKGLPGPSALCWVDHWGALGSLRKGGQRNVAVSDSFPWGHLDLAGSLSSWKPLLSSWQLSPHKSSPFKSY